MTSSNNGPTEAGIPGATQQNNGPIVHVRADSDSTLDDLFSIVTQGSQRPLQVPLRMRNLPPSFWKPPPSGSKSPSCHSRENSVDNTLDPMSPGMQSVGSPQPATAAAPPPPPTSQPFHSRAHSSPATLQQTLAVAQQQTQHLHLRQPSYDVSTSGDNLGPLPPGWEQAQTPAGQTYFMNHINKTTQWDDPRKQQHMQVQQQLQQQLNGRVTPASPQPGNNALPPPPAAQNGAMSPQHQRSNSSGGSFDNLSNIPLPQGWEESFTPEGEVYFINHAQKKTTWFDPRIPLQNQRVPIQRQQDLRLQRLENERKALQNRQEEIRAQMRSATRPRSASQENVQADVNSAQEMLMRQSLAENPTTTGMDPFLSTTSQAAVTGSDLHNRQESADSGVGMGSNFNLGSIPEDIPDVDMDTADLDSTLTEASVNGGQTVVAPPQAAAAATASGMDTSEQLNPSLNVELSSDLMQDALVSQQVSNPLTWL